MSLKSCTEESANRRKLEIEVDAETFAKACQAAYQKNVRKISVPGFRKGKAPRAIIERMYGKEFFYEDAVNEIYPVALEAAIKEGGLEYVDDKIDLDVSKVGEDGLTFTAVITVKPEVKLGSYKGIKATRPSAAVTDEEIDAEIEKTRERNARTIDIDDRAAQNGDIAVFDFDGYVDDQPFEGGKAEGYKLTLGSGNFIPGFEDQMVGHNVGEDFDVNVTFPEDYHATELAGKPAVFKIKLHELKAKELPELDDEFVKDVSEFDTLDQYKDDIRSGLQKKAEEKAKDAVDEQIIDAIVEMLEADIPQAMIENRIDHNVQDFAYRLQSQGLNFEDYLKFTGATMDAIRGQMREQAEKQVKMRLAFEKIVKDESIEVSDDELDAEYKKLADAYGMEADAVKNAINAEDLRNDLKVEKAVDLVRDCAEISDSE